MVTRSTKDIGMMRCKRIGIINLTLGLVLVAWLLSPLQLANLTLDYNLSILFVWIIAVSLGVACLCLIRRKWLGMAASLPFVAVSVLYPLILLFSTMGGGPFVVYEKIASVELHDSRVVAYRTNGGATIDFGIEVQQERSLVPGIMLARLLHNEEGSWVALEVTEGGQLVVKIDGTTTEYAMHDFTSR